MPAILKATRQVAASSKLIICSLAGGKYLARANNHVVKPELDNTMIMIDSSRDMRNCLISGSAMPHSIAQASYLITMSFSFGCHGCFQGFFSPSEDCSEEFQRLMQGLT